MSAFRMVALIPLALFAAACGRSEKPLDRTVDPALMSDLESAAAPTAALAARSFERTRVVSAIELGEPAVAPKPERNAAPRARATPRAAPRPAPAAPAVQKSAPESEIEAASEPVVVAVAPPVSAAEPVAEPAAAPAPVATPTAGPRPTPNPVPVDLPQPTSRGGGGIIGAIGGVIIRGGSIGDDDHCEIHPGAGAGIIIDRQIPVVRPTFPRGAW